MTKEFAKETEIDLKRVTCAWEDPSVVNKRPIKSFEESRHALSPRLNVELSCREAAFSFLANHFIAIGEKLKKAIGCLARDSHSMKRQIDVRFWQDPDRDGVEMCRVRDSNHVFPTHFHDQTYGIALMSVGSSYVIGPRHSDVVVSPGEIALINPGQVHSGVPVGEDRITYRMFYLSTSRMNMMAERLREGSGLTAEFRRSVVRDPRLFSRLDRFAGLLARPGGRLELDSALMDALCPLLFRHGGVSPPCSDGSNERTAIRRAREFLAEDLERKVTLEAVADAVGLSPYHFLRVFRKATGLSPHVFRTQRRLDRAADLLREGRSIAEVALETGFADQSHFTRTFRRYIGATPGQFILRK